MLDVSKLSKEEREFVTGIINRLDSGDVKNVGSELLAEFRGALTAEIFQKGYRLGDVLCEGNGAEGFNEALKREEKSPPTYDLCGLCPVSGRQEDSREATNLRNSIVAAYVRGSVALAALMEQGGNTAPPLRAGCP